MKRLLLMLSAALTLSIPALARDGTVLVIDKLAPKNGAFVGVVDSSQTAVSTATFSKNLTSADTDVQHALTTLDQLVAGGGGASTLSVNRNGTQVSSPTAQINFSGSYWGVSQLATSTSTITLVGGNTNYIQNINTLQSGATAYPSYIYVGSSETVLGQLSVSNTFFVNDPTAASGSSLLFDPNQTNPILILNAKAVSNVPEIQWQSQSVNFARLFMTPTNPPQFQINLASDTTGAGANVRYSVAGDTTSIYDKLGNNVFTIGGSSTTAWKRFQALQEIAASSHVYVRSGAIQLSTNYVAATSTLSVTNNFVAADTSGGARTLTLPKANNVGDGFFYFIYDEVGTAATSNITIAAKATDQIDGASTKVISKNYGSLIAVSDGSNWFTVSDDSLTNIKSQNTLQSGTTFFVSSGSVSGQLDASTITAKTSLFIPYSAAPVMSTGSIAIDTTADQLIFMSTPGVTRVLYPRFVTGVAISSVTTMLPATTSTTTFFSPPAPVTVKDVWCRYDGSGTVVGTFQLQTSAGTNLTYGTLTCSSGTTNAGIVAVTANGSIAVGQALQLRLTNTPSPGSDNYFIWVDYTWDQQ